MFARGWTPLDEDVHFPPAWFAKISKLRTVGSEMPHTTWGKDGWITFKLPAWLVACLVILVIVIAIAVIASPELAAQVGALLAQLVHTSSAQK